MTDQARNIVNRWFVVICAILVQIALGAIYAWSVFTNSLLKEPYNFSTVQTQAIFSAGLLCFVIILTTTRGETEVWFLSSWDFARQIAPLLLVGVLAAGFLLGRPGAEGLIPSRWVGSLVGGNSLWSNLFASIVGALMYFATLTEVPILQGLMGAGMGKGPALALLLAGPALSLPNMLVIRSVIGTDKTVVFVFLVVLMATLSGLIFGHLTA